MSSDLSRRCFLKIGIGVGGSFAIGFPIFAKGSAANNQYVAGLFEIDKNGRILLTIDRHDMGQGVIVGILTLAAEELNMPPAMMDYQLASVGSNQYNKDFVFVSVGGSSSMRTSWRTVRMAAAFLREVLVTAAQLELTSRNVNFVSPILKDGGIEYGDGQRLDIIEVLSNKIACKCNHSSTQ